MPKADHLNHTPRPEDIPAIEQIRSKLIETEELFDELCPTGRDLSVAKTKLEEARMWAVKSIALQGTPQEINA